MQIVNDLTHEGYGIGRLPGRKQVVLYRIATHGTTIIPLAYFKDEQEAQALADWLEWALMNARAHGMKEITDRMARP